jgi:SAM-dependent methyltransferase
MPAPQTSPPSVAAGRHSNVGPRMRAVYDRLAPAFAARNAALPASISEAAGPAFVALARAVSGDRPPAVVEAGCGPGRDMAWLEAAGAVVVGLDLPAGMLAHARTRAAGPLVQADLRRVPLAAGCFHGAWCNAALLHLPKADAPGALAGLRRRLVPGGRAVLMLPQGTLPPPPPTPTLAASFLEFVPGSLTRQVVVLVKAWERTPTLGSKA